ncbi:MAG: adenosylmethionine--8-amino-7-oxononanoate transaminase [bacterium]
MKASRQHKYQQLDRQCIWHPYTRHSKAAAGLPVIARGKGPYLYDLDGHRYLDAVSSWWACNLGHGNPHIVKAIAMQAKTLQHSILGNLSHPRAIELASGIVELFGDGPRRVLFASDGASAVEAALKIALQYWHDTGKPERCRFASLNDAYHGDTLGAVSVGYLPGFHKAFRRSLFKVHRAESPCCAACRHGGKPDKCSVECFASMRKIIEEHRDELAAVIVEPLCQGAAGMRIYSPRYLRKLAAICRRYDILLVSDEIAVGMGRTGKMFAFQHAGIHPDIVCIGKGLSGGYLPISATVVKKKIYDAFSDQPADHTFYHGHTFAGNPIACAAALATLSIYRSEDIVTGAEKLGQTLAGEMNQLEGLPGVSGIRTLGMIGAFETPAAGRIRDRLLARNHILIRPLGNTVYLMLPLNVTHDLVRSTVSALRAAILATAEQ